MAVLKAGTFKAGGFAFPAVLDTTSLFAHSLLTDPDNTVVSRSAKKITVEDEFGTKTAIAGAFQFDSGGALVGGTITGLKSLHGSAKGLSLPVDQYLALAAANDVEGLLALALNGADKLDAKKVQWFSNVLSGFGGDDTIEGGRQADMLDGGEGNDSLKGENGDDVLDGGAGHDLLRGGKQDDTLIGGAGNDTLNGDQGLDTFRYTATSLDTGDVAAGAIDAIVDGVGDRIDFTPALEAALTVNGVALSALVAATALPAALGVGTNIAYTGAALQIDLDGSAAFAAAADFQVLLSGVAGVTYDAAGDLLLLT